MSGGGALGNNPAASAELTARYSKLFLDYKLAVNGAHFSGAAGSSPAGAGASGSSAPQQQQQVWQWEGPGGICASERPPLLAFLAAPRLPAELDRYLNHQH